MALSNTLVAAKKTRRLPSGARTTSTLSFTPSVAASTLDGPVTDFALAETALCRTLAAFPASRRVQSTCRTPLLVRASPTRMMLRSSCPMPVTCVHLPGGPASAEPAPAATASVATTEMRVLRVSTASILSRCGFSDNRANTMSLCPEGGLGAVAHPDALEDAREVGLDCLLAYLETARDQLVGKSLGHHREHLALARREAAAGRASCRSASNSLAARGASGASPAAAARMPRSSSSGSASLRR